MIKKNLFIVFLFGLQLISFAQKSDEFKADKEVTYDGKRYRVYNNYLTIGAGKARNDNISGLQFAGAADFNFHLKQYYFQTGAMLAGNYFGSYNYVQGHVCAGKRFEQNRYNIAGYLGGSFSSMNLTWEDTIVHPKYISAPGLYACVQTTYKYKYDLGIGFAFFADFNKYQSLFGVRLELFFSGAYRRAVWGEQNMNQKDETYQH